MICVVVAPAGMAQWSATGSLKYARQSHSATLLPNGMVLVAGGLGRNGVFPPEAELYDSSAGSWGAGGSLAHPRIFHSANLLSDGRVMIAGGQSPGVIGINSVELFNPATGEWTEGTAMNKGRDTHTGTVLRDGRVLVAGGEGACASGGGLTCVLVSAEIYDPQTGKWSDTGSMHVARLGHSATLLDNGQVLVTGGHNAQANLQYGIASCELYDPGTGTWSLTGPMSVRRGEFTANLLPSREVLAAAGGADMITGRKTAELYNPQTGTWGSTGSLHVARERQASATLSNGRVLVTGGTGTCGAGECPTLTSAELYDPRSGTWTSAGNMVHRRWAHQATTLPSGLVLVEGGVWTENIFEAPPLASAEIFTPAN
jgi:N-acetylneuraminic acid mutarotase